MDNGSILFTTDTYIHSHQMNLSEPHLKTCNNGHTFYKKSDCPVCPICEKEQENVSVFSDLSAPARRALENEKITTVKILSSYSQSEILKLHGIGRASLPIFQKILASENLSFKNQ